MFTVSYVPAWTYAQRAVGSTQRDRRQRWTTQPNMSVMPDGVE